MGKTAQIRARTDPAVKQQAEAVLAELGITPSAAITMFYKQIIHHGGLPFAVALPNETTRRAIEDARAGRRLVEGESVADLLGRLDDDE